MVRGGLECARRGGGAVTGGVGAGTSCGLSSRPNRPLNHCTIEVNNSRSQLMFITPRPYLRIIRLYIIRFLQTQDDDWMTSIMAVL